MTYAPQTLLDLEAFWVAEGGVALGIVGNAAHTWGYHCGRDRIYGPGGQKASDYSVKTARDRAGLTDAAAAIDFGKLHGSLYSLELYSKWLVEQCRTNKPGTSDIREIIYSPDGTHVFGWNREAGVNSAPILNYGDDTHLWHTHISFYRDSEHRDKRPTFSGYFNPELPNTATEASMPGLSVRLLATSDNTPLDAFGTAKVKGAKHAIIRVSDKLYKPVADGLDLGVVQKGELVTPLDGVAGDRRSVVVFNSVGEQYVALLMDVTFTPLPAPPDPSPYIKFAANAAYNEGVAAALAAADNGIKALAKR